MLSILKTNRMKFFVIALACTGSLVTLPAQAGIDGVPSQFDIYKNWYSAEVCFSQFCVWRAATQSQEVPDAILMIEKPVNIDGIYKFSIHAHNVSQTSLLSWGTRTEDQIRVKLRVDYGQTREVTVNRKLDKADKTLYWNIPIDDREDFLKELQKGTTLRVRVYNDTPVTMSFSLSGAYAVIERMQTENYKDERQKKAINSDPYFRDEI